MPRAAWEITREMFLARDEVAALLAHLRAKAPEPTSSLVTPEQAAAAVDRLIVETLLFSGLRNSEFCRLRLADTRVGLRASVLAVRDDDDAGRLVHVPAALSRLIEAYVRHIRPRYLPEDLTPEALDAPLLLNERRGPYERTGLYRRVVRILTEAGLGDRASVQLLRHTYGYLAYQSSGGNLLFVQRQLGHAHPMVTAVYAQFVEESYPDLAERLQEVETPAPRADRRRARPPDRSERRAQPRRRPSRTNSPPELRR